MSIRSLFGKASCEFWPLVMAGLIAVSHGLPTTAAPVNPEAFKRDFEAARKDAEVVAQVRVLAVVCKESADAKEGGKALTLELALQVINAEKGPVKKNDVLVVTHKVTTAAGPGPRAYGYMAALRKFPFTPGVKGSVALRWDKDRRGYVGIAGWVPEPNNQDVPTEAGKSGVAPEQAKKD